MTAAILGRDGQSIADYLETNSICAEAMKETQIPSLTALLAVRQDISSVVIMEDCVKNWSMGHILAAAKQLQGKGRMIFLGKRQNLPALICAAADREALLSLLIKPPATEGGRRKTLLSPKMPAVIRPLYVAPGIIPILGVLGSQHRIGCTTQAVGLWHYCKALGLDPALVTASDTISQIVSTMQTQDIPGGYQIEGIPFVTSTALAYDCYILDLGTDPPREALQNADCLVLVAGGKPWELSSTAAALRKMRDKEMCIFLAFSTQEDAEALRPLFGGQKAAVLPWMPNLWKSDRRALALYDLMLRPILENLFSRETPQPEEHTLQSGG